MHIVTAGAPYMDIDAYAGCVAYAELLQAQGKQAIAASTAPFNESITRTVRFWNAPVQTTYKFSDADVFTLIDVSDPAYFDKIVTLEQVEGVIDHHTGFEKYWQQRLGDKACIEFIGAACTLVYEQWQAAGFMHKMSELSAKLLICGILDNTINFGAKITTPRDKQAYEALITIANLPNDWTVQYFTECENSAMSHLATAVQNDTKILSFASFAQPICAGQATVWDGKQVLTHHQGSFQQILGSIKPEWFLNIISVKEGKSYFVADEASVKSWLSKLLNIKFDGSIATADRLWLRKEIIKLERTLTDQST